MVYFLEVGANCKTTLKKQYFLHFSTNSSKTLLYRVNNENSTSTLCGPMFLTVISWKEITHHFYLSSPITSLMSFHLMERCR